MEWQNVVEGQRADPEQINKIGNQVAKYKGLRIARRIVLTEAVSSITFDTDDDGNPLDIRLGGELIFYSGGNTTIGTGTQMYIQFNGATTGNYWYNTVSSASHIYIGYLGNLFSENLININILHNNLIANSNFTYCYSGGGGNNNFGGGMSTPQMAVMSIRLFLSTGTFPVGTVIEWWERG